jgi:hypothetical protein
MDSAKRRVAVSLCVATGVLVASSGLAAMAYQEFDDQVTLAQRLDDSEAQAKSALEQARASLELARRVGARYAQLQGAGFFEPIDKPRAIDWAEAQLGPHFDAVSHYQIGGSNESAPLPGARYQVDLSRVSIDFEPLHEERFLDVWNAIASIRGAVGSVENCELKRPQEEISVGGASGAKVAHIKARCLLTWYRLENATTAAPGAPVSGSTPKAGS